MINPRSCHHLWPYTNTLLSMHTYVSGSLNTDTAFNIGVIVLWPKWPKRHEEFKCKNRYTHFFINLGYLRLKLLKNRENNRNICDIVHHNFKNGPYVLNKRGVIEKVLFCSFWSGTYFKNFEIGVCWFFAFRPE